MYIKKAVALYRGWGFRLFKPINQKSESVYQKIVNELKSSIVQGKLKPGDKLPGERDLSEMLGVSRTSLREALKLLAASGLVTIKHGQGVFIAEQDQETYIRRFVEHILIDKEKIAELFAIRKVLEVNAAAWAAEKGKPDQKLALREIVIVTKQKLNGDKGDLLLLAEHDSAFHNTLAAATNNSVLINIMYSLLDLIGDSRCQAMQVPSRPLKSLDEHLAVADAIIAGDQKKAKEKMLQHLDAVEKDVLND